MSRRVVVPCLVIAVFLSGCKSAQQGAGGAVGSVSDRVGDWWCATEEGCQDWLECHPVARSVVCGVGLGILTAALVALLVAAVYVECQGDH
jgi:hypothetical protein